MPELPEVETIVKYLRRGTRGRKILDAEVLEPRVFRRGGNPEDFRRMARNKIVKDARRMGKNIVFRLGGNLCLIIHLMMTGRLLFDPPAKSAHDRLILRFSGNKNLVLNDARKFGRVCLASCRGLKRRLKIGPDALAVDFKSFKKIFQRRKTAVKSVLLNQALVAGVGNIYADEILWQAGINPARPAFSLAVCDIRGTYRAMRRVLNFAILKEGTSARNYVKPDGEKGGYYPLRKVYQRKGERCSRDGAVIRRMVINSRSAYACPGHQK